MKKHGLSQEALKTIACVTMLLDHIGATIVLNCIYRATGAERVLWMNIYEALRTMGRLSFPIYCFLLVEGVFYTKNPWRYGLRLLTCAILAEIPFDLTFYDKITFAYQSTMVTLLLGFLMLEIMKKCPNLLKLLLVLPFAFVAQKLGTDYGDKGIMLIAVFAFTRDVKFKHLWQFLGIWYVFSPDHRMMFNWLGGIRWTIRELAVFAVIPIALYSGEKTTNSKILQWVFYLFYPAHLLVLHLIQTI